MPRSDPRVERPQGVLPLTELGGKMIARVRTILFSVGLPIATAVSAAAQSPTPTPPPTVQEDYTVRSSIEIGYRWLDVNGSLNKYRSDLNYKAGVRIFDSSFFIENNTDEGWFDSALINASGFGGDPSGMFRLNIGKAGGYTFDANVRRVSYFNNLINHVNPNNTTSSLHNANTTHDIGDFDATIFPESEKLRIRMGFSYNRTEGLGGFTHRAYSDEFGVESEADAGSDDFRFGVDGKVLGFNMGITYGHRDYRDRIDYFLSNPSLGNNPTNNARLFTFDRMYPIDGTTDYANFFLQRTFAGRFDMTARFIYSFSDTDFSLNENATGRDNSNNFVDQDLFIITGRTKRSQTRGDLGLTWRATDKFRISNTFTIDDFDISGTNRSSQDQRRRNAAGNPIAPVIDNDTEHRATAYRRYSNLIEGDYQVGSRFGFNLGYRYTHRDVAIWGFDMDLDPVTLVNHFEESQNTTHAIIAGIKAKPHKNWSIFGDIEHGTADNVFTRLANSDYTNYRVRSRASFSNVVFNISAIARRNDNPARSIVDPTRDYVNQVRSNTFSTSIDWEPIQQFSVSGGYTYLHLNSVSDIRVPLGGTPQLGVSQFYIRDSYYFIDVTANFKRVAFFGSYRFNDDNGQGSRVTPPPSSPNILTSYPMQMHSPEFRVAIKLHKNVDWNLGYQFYKYQDIFAPAQNYNAHLPYTSLRFYFGKSSDR